jgi:spore coat polysaccharide biosynthesis protein SpsF
MGSTRLPGKVLLPLNGHSVIGEVLTRCKRIAGVDEVVCATPDVEVLHEAARYVSVFKGPEDDVLQRYVEAAEFYGADIVMRITADCPLLSPSLCADILKSLQVARADYASNVLPRTFPKGFDCEVFTRDMLRDADLCTPNEEREHVTPWMQRESRRGINIENRWPLDGRLTLDTWADYEVICAAFGHEADPSLRPA